MSPWMRAVAFVTVAVFTVLLLTACGQSVEDVKKDAEFAKVCNDGGGRVAYSMFNEMFCIFGGKP